MDICTTHYQVFTGVHTRSHRLPSDMLLRYEANKSRLQNNRSVCTHSRTHNDTRYGLQITVQLQTAAAANRGTLHARLTSALSLKAP